MLALIHIGDAVDAALDSILRTSFRLRHCRVTLRASRRARPILAPRELRNCRLIYPRLCSISGRAVVPFSNLDTVQPNIRYYVFLREPIERAATEYVTQVGRSQNPVPLETWIRSAANRNRQTRQLCTVADAQAAIEMLQSRVHFLGLAERFHQSLVMFARWCQDPRMDIRFRPAFQPQDVTARVRQLLRDLQTRRLLLEANREDVDVYQFASRELYPQQVDDYGPTLDRDVQIFEAFNLPRSRFPRETLSIMWRELVHRPLVPWLTSRTNPALMPSTAKKPTPRRRAA